MFNLSGFHRFSLRSLFVCILLSGTYSSTCAFDTYWHFSAAEEVGRIYKFSPDAIKVIKFSSFCLDYFGPFVTEIVGTIVKSASYLELRNLPATGETHAASNFLHFDNLAGKLNRNWKFNYLWSRLLENTRNAIISFQNDSGLTVDDQKKLILLTLGASLHMVEDFYSHTDWTHFNFKRMGFPGKETDDGFDRAPTWFEVRKKLGAPSARHGSENWKFRLCTGVFPPPDSAPKTTFGVPLSHTPMNHDNSQLYYNGESQIKYHGFGAYPAHDSASAVKHQLFAYHTACAAAIEWVGLVEENPRAKKAIEYAKGWDLKKLKKDDYADDLDDGLSSALLLSCIMQKWDGNYPPPERDKDCGTFKLIGHLHIPKMSNLFWGSFPKDSILQKISLGFGDSTGNYTFDSLWVGKRK